MPKGVYGGIICLEKNYKAWVNSHLDLGKCKKKGSIKSIGKTLEFFTENSWIFYWKFLNFPIKFENFYSCVSASFWTLSKGRPVAFAIFSMDKSISSNFLAVSILACSAPSAIPAL